jgi:hypothetical protein
MMKVMALDSFWNELTQAVPEQRSDGSEYRIRRAEARR